MWLAIRSEPQGRVALLTRRIQTHTVIPLFGDRHRSGRTRSPAQISNAIALR